MTQKTKPTYVELAKASGVSTATISRAMNGGKNVSKKARRKIVQAIGALGYNADEVLPRTQSGGFILFNIPSFANPFYDLIIQGARDAAKRNGNTLLIHRDDINETTLAEFLAMIQTQNPSGLIITNPVSPVMLDHINALVPVVQCSECNENLDMPFVTIDNVGAAKYAVEHLISLERRRIAFLNGPLLYKYARDRLIGYNKALKEVGMDSAPEHVVQLDEINYDMAFSAAYQLLNTSNRPDAFFCSSDVYAAAVIKAALRLGLSVPDDVAVVGFDNIEISSMCIPSITTVNQPRYQLGLLSCDMLSERIGNKNIPVRSVYLETELIVRESTVARVRKTD